MDPKVPQDLFPCPLLKLISSALFLTRLFWVVELFFGFFWFFVFLVFCFLVLFFFGFFFGGGGGFFVVFFFFFLGLRFFAFLANIPPLSFFLLSFFFDVPNPRSILLNFLRNDPSL